MKAMIFAAGLGTRLGAVTSQSPKALAEAGGKPLLQHVIERLIGAGVHEVVINVHHFPELIRAFLSQHNNFGMTVHISDESDALLDTGGGLMKAAPLLAGDEPVLVHNVDVLSNLCFEKLIEYHKVKKSLATLVVRDRETRRYLLFGNDLRLTGWMNRSTGEIRRSVPGGAEIPLAFSGIQVIDPQFFKLVNRRGKFSLIDCYLELAASFPVYGYRDDSTLWMDVGKPAELAAADRLLRKLETKGRSER